MSHEPEYITRPLKNRWYALRHGQSSANVAGLIISDPDTGTIDFGLTSTGYDQVRNTMNTQTQLDSNTLIYSSDFLRTLNTASVAAHQINASSSVITSTLLRERNFGKWERSSAANYEKVWRDDYNDANHTNHQVESVTAVAQRASSLVDELELLHTARNILLVSHGDTLQILECVFRNLPLETHRDLTPLDTAELRRLA
ncbi:hypothetical protein AB833_13040 [Chromatiales bacterium (ex Bugula neritina AB1)]|nr:hypothetical protein AB833_13040 [Chromatiales bacterium (ex Bugula neritina AB1)]